MRKLTFSVNRYLLRWNTASVSPTISYSTATTSDTYISFQKFSLSNGRSVIIQLTVNGNTAAGTFMGFTGSTVGFCGVKSGDSSLYYNDQVVAQGLFAIPDDTTLRFVISPDYFNIYVSNQLFLSEPYSFSIDTAGYNVTVGNQTTAPGNVSFTWDEGVGLDWAVGALQVNSVGVVVRGPYSSVRMIVTGVANLEGLGSFWTLSELRFLSPAGSKCVAYDMVLADIDGSEIRQMIYGPNTTQTDPVWENFGAGHVWI